MDNHKVVSRSEWIEARKRLLAEEKGFTRARDRLSQQRRDLPWERVDKEYIFEGPTGKETLPQLFDGKTQLIVYHFMFDPTWKEGCKGCSFWADNLNGIVVHLRQRDVTLLAISRAPLHLLEAFKKRMGWSFKWISSFGTDFNHDYHVSFTPEELATGQIYYNYETGKRPFSGEAPGVSVFYKNPRGEVFHTYSCYMRGLDILNGAYHYLDLVPKGRDEEDLPYPMSWVRHHDRYDD
ncbi:MAG TPA: thioredoxin family protein [Myxococcota bacterium]|nr:thioredoxin family protein [Myxococcota bacterium]